MYQKQIQTIAQCDAIYGIKDRHSNFLAVSNSLAQLAGFSSADTMLGLSDADLNCDAGKLFELYQVADKEVIENNKSIRELSFLKYADEWRLLLTTKKPYYRIDTDDVAIEGESIDITNIGLLNTGVLLSDFLHDKIVNKEPFHFIVEPSYSSVNLSRQESLCLFYFVHGYPIKVIAKEMDISPGSVDTYLERIKNKLTCTNRSQLIEKMHEANLMYSLLGLSR
jgi:DNA-binding CsgD family transcriptional regulator